MGEQWERSLTVILVVVSDDDDLHDMVRKVQAIINAGACFSRDQN